MVRLIVLFVISYVGLVQVSFAVEPLSEGFYVGASLGVSDVDDDHFFDDNGYNLDDNDVAAGVFGGYKFNPYFALEGRYTSFGTFEAKDENKLSKGYSDDLDADALSVHAVGIVPLGSSGWSIFGQAGYARVGVDSNSSENALSYGVGVSYNTTENWSFALQGDLYGWDEGDYDYEITTIQLAARYAF
jgi:OOP family OmpA-OmpF porin